MCEEIKLRKLDSESWGFRLTGGRDFGTPLTVLRVTGASVAEESGMEVGDMIVSINGESTQSMTHVEAQQHILGSGSNLNIQILRGCPVPAPELIATTPLRGMTPNISGPRCDSALTNDSYDAPHSIEDIIPSLHFHHAGQEVEPSGNLLHVHEEELTEQKIAEKMLENAELLEGNVIGVNFKRFIPKVDFIKNSLVYQVLQEEQIYEAKTEEEQLEKTPEKRFSTFLVHPNNSKPKQPKKDVKLKTKRPKTPIAPVEQENQIKEEEKEEIKKETITQKEQTSLENPDEPNPEQTKDINIETKENINEVKEEKTDEKPEENGENGKEKDTAVEETDLSNIIEQTDSSENSKSSESLPIISEPSSHLSHHQKELPSIKEDDEETPDDSEFTRQLGLIRTQLESLRQLPSLIEIQLNLFQTQLDVLKDLRQNTNKTSSNIELTTTSEQNNDSKEENPETDSIQATNIETEGDVEQNQINNKKYDEQNVECYKGEQEIICNTESIIPEEKLPVQKPKSKKSSLFNGITPQPRPVVLPGGRIWRKPKDAYNEQFIAETLVTQAEVLIGTNTGVNFRKYEPPKFAMSESAVWRLINNLENKSEEPPAENDFYHSPIDEKKIFVAGLHMNPDVEIVVKEVAAEEALRNAPAVNNHHIENILVAETA